MVLDVQFCVFDTAEGEEFSDMDFLSLHSVEVAV